MSAFAGTGSKMTPVGLAVLEFATAVSVAGAYEWYYINRRPASTDDARIMAARGLPFADYWVRNDGDWGVAGESDVQGNVYGRRPALSERGLLYSPAEWLR